jgi:hypothetical protein
MITTMTRKRLISDLVSLCSLSFITGLSVLQGFQYWLRSDPLYWVHLGIVLLVPLVIVFVFRRTLNSLLPANPGT